MPPARRIGQGWLPHQGAAINDFADKLLEVRDVVVRFGGVTALDHVSFDVRPREIRGLIGPNGSGKTTLFNCLSNIYRCDAGEIRLAGRRISGLQRHRMAALGLGRTFQNVALFATLSVEDNLLVGAHRLAARGREPARLEAMLSLLDLAPLRRTVAGTLPFPLQKRVELARALMGEPKLLLLDEPAAGLNHEEVQQLADLIRAVREQFATAVLLVEHHMSLVMSVSDRVVALEFGRKIADGLPGQVQTDPDVIRAYLGAPA